VTIFEPTKHCFEILSGRFEDMRIVLNNVACSDKSGVAEIYYDREGSGMASMYKRNLDMFDVQLNLKEVIKTKRLDEYIEQKGIKHIDFMKVDVEGHEIQVFNGIGKFLNCDFIDYMQFEYGGTNIDSRTPLLSFYELFVSRGFILAKIMPEGLQIRDYEPFLEIFEYSNYVAISKKVLK